MGLEQIMDLVNRDYLRVQNIPSQTDENNERELSLKITYKNPLKLKKFERDILEFFKNF